MLNTQKPNPTITSGSKISYINDGQTIYGWVKNWHAHKNSKSWMILYTLILMDGSEIDADELVLTVEYGIKDIVTDLVKL